MTGHSSGDCFICYLKTDFIVKILVLEVTMVWFKIYTKYEIIILNDHPSDIARQDDEASAEEKHYPLRGVG